MAVTVGVREFRQDLADYIDGDEPVTRHGRRVTGDRPLVAAALALDCPIWTEDKDFFGPGVAIWTSDLVEVYLRGDIRPHTAAD